MVRSVFSFNFRLTPWNGCLNLNSDHIKLSSEFAAVCARDNLGIIWQGDVTRNDSAHATAHILARALIHAEAFLSFPDGIVLNVEPVTWLEVRDVRPAKIVSGYMHESLKSAPLDSKHPDTARLSKAAARVRALGNHPALQLAFADFYAARREVGAYADFYAYRVLEDVGYHFGVTKEEKPDWNTMNASLGTSKKTWDLLTEAGTKARHFNVQSLSKQKVSKRALLQLAHRAVELTLRKLDID